VKKASPSRGLFKQDFSVESLVKAYTTAGASAISVVTEEDFSEAVRNGGSQEGLAHLPPVGSLKETVATLEKRLIAEALRTRQQNQQQTAKMLGLSRQGLIKKMKRYGIKAA
jgi:transcriptional regulator with PAS, ATPase and Fis domain